MAHHKYLIVGGGLAGDAAVRGIREVDPEGSIGMVSAEPDLPYHRPALSKKLWTGKTVAQIFLGTERAGVEMFPGREVRGIDAAGKTVFDHAGATYSFDKLLLATGGTPRHLPLTNGDVIYFRTLQDFRRLHEAARKGARVAVIGGGFIGSELAAALVGSGCETVMLFPESSVCARIFPPDLASSVTDVFRQKGVEVLSGESLASVESRGGRQVLLTTGGTQRTVDIVVAGVGLAPNIALAQGAGLRVEGGILVDEMMRTSHPDIHAAGDVATHWSAALGVRVRVEHEDAAVTQGRAAGRAMAGHGQPYRHVPFFYSDLFELGYEAVGRIDPALETFSDWKEPYQEGVVYYLLGGRVKGVLLWNVWEKVDAARELIASAKPVNPAELEGRIVGEVPKPHFD